MPEAVTTNTSRLWMPIHWALARVHSAGHLIAHLAHHLPAALAVTSLVTLGHLQFHLLDAIDGYAFLGIGNLSAWESPRGRGGAEARAAVVVIDQQSHENYYRERSPLNRCELARDLASLYQLSPQVLVIDLDLSPSLVDADSAQKVADCERTLYELIKERRNTKTVLMEPFPVLDKAANAETEIWRGKMREAGVVFGDATLPVRYGLVTQVDCKPDTLAAVALAQRPREEADNCLKHKNLDLLINPRQYLTGLRAIAVADLPSRRAALETELGSALDALPSELPAVFFGGTYGDGDTFLTPLGIMYGVEVHAAAYLSLLEPATDVDHLIGFGLEVGLAVIFGGVIAACWRSYYVRRFSSSALERQLSPVLVVALAIALVVLVMATTMVSLYLLSRTDYWLSPIPIATGMLVESFFAGAVTEAVKEGHKQRQALVLWLDKAHQESTESFRLAVEQAKKQRPPDGYSLREGCWRFFIGDVGRLYKKGARRAALAVLSRRLFFLALLGLALYKTAH